MDAIGFEPPGHMKDGRLVAQCTHRRRNKGRRGQRCKHWTFDDYRFCRHHLIQEHHVVVAPSRIPNAGLGVFAVDPKTLRSKGMDAAGRPVRCECVVVFGRHRLLTPSFGGERLDMHTYDGRYPDGQGVYVTGGDVDGDAMFDEMRARTVFGNANDAINLGDPERRRNVAGRTPVMPDWPHAINCTCVFDPDTELTHLVTCARVRHGDELLWSYACSTKPSKVNGHWRRDPDTKQVIDRYWRAYQRT